MNLKKTNIQNTKKIEFNNNFLIGGSLFSENIDGSWDKINSKSNWDSMFSSNRKKFYNNIGPKSFSGILENIDSYIEYIINSGINNINISLSWSNLFPNENEVNHYVLDYYKELFSRLHDNKISFIVSFINFDLPLWFIEKEGFFKKENIKYVLSFVEFIVNHFGSFFKLAYTFDDPIKMLLKYDLLKKENPGNITKKQEYINLITNIILFNSKISEFLKQKNKDIKTGIKLSFVPFIFSGNRNINFNPDSKLYKYNILINFGALDYVVKGSSDEFDNLVNKILKLKIDLSNEEREIIKEYTANFLGVKYSGVCFLTNKENNNQIEIFDEFLYFSSKDKEMDINYLDELFKIIKIKYKNIPSIFHTTFKSENEEIYDKENKIIDDIDRTEFISKTLSIINKNIKNNDLRIMGYFYENIFDSWDYFDAFKYKNGLYGKNIIDSKIINKSSSYWYKRLCTNKHFFDFSIKTSISKEVSIETKTKLLDFF